MMEFSKVWGKYNWDSGKLQIYLDIIPLTNFLINEIQTVIIHLTNGSSSFGFQSVNFYCKVDSYLSKVKIHPSIWLIFASLDRKSFGKNNKRTTLGFSLMDFQTLFKPNYCCCWHIFQCRCLRYSSWNITDTKYYSLHTSNWQLFLKKTQ